MKLLVISVSIVAIVTLFMLLGSDASTRRMGGDRVAEPCGHDGAAHTAQRSSERATTRQAPRSTASGGAPGVVFPTASLGDFAVTVRAAIGGRGVGFTEIEIWVDDPAPHFFFVLRKKAPDSTWLDRDALLTLIDARLGRRTSPTALEYGELIDEADGNSKLLPVTITKVRQLTLATRGKKKMSLRFGPASSRRRVILRVVHQLSAGRLWPVSPDTDLAKSDPLGVGKAGYVSLSIWLNGVKSFERASVELWRDGTRVPFQQHDAYLWSRATLARVDGQGPLSDVSLTVSGAASIDWQSGKTLTVFVEVGDRNGTVHRQEWTQLLDLAR